MFGIIEVALDVNDRIFEIRFRFTLRRCERARDFFERTGDLQALAATAAGGFERDRQAVFFRRGDRVVCGTQRRRRTGNDRNPRGDHRLARANLVAHRIDRIRMRSDPREPRGDHGACEPGVLRKKSITRMNGIRARSSGDVEKLLDIQVTKRWRCRAEQKRFVRISDVQSVAIAFGIDGYREEPEFAGGAHDAHGDLATIGDE